ESHDHCNNNHTQAAEISAPASVGKGTNDPDQETRGVLIRNADSQYFSHQADSQY
ncbi:MAG: hypothetical protein QG577_1349, partial [Thermodesulfobacteriota bacterium]|nr:hypothetical protein [Thermodesulfobacteriota bacterium]